MVPLLEVLVATGQGCIQKSDDGQYLCKVDNNSVILLEAAGCKRLSVVINLHLTTNSNCEFR
jgi:hypothetical protein